MQQPDLIAKLRKSIHKGLADAVLRQPQQTAFLVGAGISIESELPSFWEFEKTVLDALIGDVLSDEEQEPVMASLRPEVLIQALWQTYGQDVFDVYRTLDCGHPNPNHYLLAEALRRGACVLTTNVDTLIEAACQEIGFDDLQVLFTPEHCQDTTAGRLPGQGSWDHRPVETRRRAVYLDPHGAGPRWPRN